MVLNGIKWDEMGRNRQPESACLHAGEEHCSEMKTRKKDPRNRYIRLRGSVFLEAGYMVYSPGQKIFSAIAVLQPKLRLVWYNGYRIDTIAIHLEILSAGEQQGTMTAN